MPARHWAGLAGLAGGIAGFVAVSARWHGQFDLRIYYGAVSFWLHGGDLYAYRQPAAVRDYGFTYPPFAAIMMAPMTAVAWPAAAVLLAASSVTATFALLRQRFRRLLPTLVAVTLLAAAEPWRDTLSFGQVNILLLALVGIDMFVLLGRHPAAGCCIGLAAGIKLTPALFIVYLVLTRRYRAAAVATGSAAATVGLGWLIAPGPSGNYWTTLVWQTNRVGDLAFVSNQSLAGAVARLGAPAALWTVLVALTLAVWAWRVRAADAWGGLALTGLTMCLVSPVSWVHHLVWQLPALLVLIDDPRRRLWLRYVGAGALLLMASRVVWLFQDQRGLPSLLGADMFVVIGLILLLIVPARSDVQQEAGRPRRSFLRLEMQPAVPELED